MIISGMGEARPVYVREQGGGEGMAGALPLMMYGKFECMGNQDSFRKWL